IETMQRLGPDGPQWSSLMSSIYPGLFEVIGRAVYFHFGDLQPEKEHVEFALDLYERKLFTLPYETVAFGFSPPHNVGVAASALMILGYTKEDASIDAIMCSEARHRGQYLGGMPIGYVRRATFSAPDFAASSVQMTENTVPLLSASYMRMTYG